MEGLIRGLVSSTKHKAGLKNQLLTKMFGNLKHSNLTPSDYSGLFKLFFEWVLSSNQPNLVQHGHEQIIDLAKRRPDLFKEFINPNLLIDLFTNSLHSNKKDMIMLLGEILDILKLPKDSKDEENDEEDISIAIKNSKQTNERDNEDQQRSVTNVARSHLINLIRDHGVHMEVTNALSNVYQDHPELLPTSADSRNWIAISVIKLLAGYRPNNSTTSNTSTIDPSFVDTADNISKVLPLIWGQSTNTQSISECLNTFYDIISISDSYSRPSPAMLSVIIQVPSHLLNDAMESMIASSTKNQTISSSATQTSIQSHAEKEARTVTALQTMIEWLCERPSEILSDKLMLLFNRLRQCNRNSVLIEITHGAIEKLLLALPTTSLQSSTEPLFFFLLLGFQHSETVFHQVIAALPAVFDELLHSEKGSYSSSSTSNLSSAPNLSGSKKILERLKEAVQFLILRFPGFSQLYDPLSEWLNSDCKLSKERIEELKSLSWLSEYDTNWINENRQFTSHNSTSNQIKNNCLSNNLVSSVRQRSATGMVGLINLGNTCYMNSILQALYVTDMFREQVFQATAQIETEKVLTKLQQTFAFLRYTMRAIYSPSEFLKVARPPWFEPGRQQDCSEFLRYLLDCIHEQEKGKKGDVIVYGEHQVIEANDSSDDLKPTLPTTEENEEFVQTPTNEIPDCANSNLFFSAGNCNNVIGNGKGVRPSYSTTALDSISEAPEIIETDEDMISQGSAAVQGEDLMFGSRGSLSIDSNKHLIEPELSDNSDDEDDCNAMGSRGSLGLSRWTTEENLSFGGSKEKMDLIEGGTINDSHSNSTDSGIQSVGDSIRGSSDSMSNQTPPNMEQSTNSVFYGNNKRNQIDQFSKSKNLTNTASSEQKPFVSLVQKVFGGKMQTSYQCSKCNSMSIHKEYFTDLLLAFPDPKDEENSSTQGKGSVEENGAKNCTDSEVSDHVKRDISIQQLINLYLHPEKLTGENQYHCNKCKSLQDGVKTMKILEGPKHLMCTLMRFKYDRTLNRKSKVFTDIKYELDLQIPVTNDIHDHTRTNLYQSLEKKVENDTLKNENVENLKRDSSNEEPSLFKDELYSLYAIVVHSGYSSDGGHYFTYSKVPKNSEDTSDSTEKSNEDLWYIFNDSKVTYSTFESFINMSKKFPVDTAYVLFYQKMEHDKHESNTPVPSTTTRKDLKMAVERDNIKFMREKERSALSSSSLSTSLKGFDKKDEDDDKNNGGSYGCGGNSGFNSPGRFIC